MLALCHYGLERPEADSDVALLITYHRILLCGIRPWDTSGVREHFDEYLIWDGVERRGEARLDGAGLSWSCPNWDHLSERDRREDSAWRTHSRLRAIIAYHCGSPCAASSQLLAKIMGFPPGQAPSIEDAKRVLQRAVSINNRFLGVPSERVEKVPTRPLVGGSPTGEASAYRITLSGQVFYRTPSFPPCAPPEAFLDCLPRSAQDSAWEQLLRLTEETD